MNLKREVAKRLTPYMKAKDFLLSKGTYCYVRNDIAYCISFDTPSGIMYVTAYIIPLYIPCEGRYYTYGKRVQPHGVPPLSKDSNATEVDTWCNALCQYFEDHLFPFFERICSPVKVAQYIKRSRLTGIKEFSCPPIHIDRLKLFTYLYLNDLTEVANVIISYRESLRETGFLTDSTKKILLDEIEMVEKVVQHGNHEALNFCTQIIGNTKKHLIGF